MKVALDLEDVIVESNGVFLEELQQFVRENHPDAEAPRQSDIEGWKFEGLRGMLAELQGWSSSEVEKFFEGDSNGWRGFHPITEEIWRTEPERFSPIPENLMEQLEALRDAVDERGGELYLVTARQNVDEYVRKHLDSLGIRRFFEDTVFKISKDELGFDVYIDDYPHLHEKLESGIHLMVDQPWNAKEELESPHRRVSSIDEAAEVIRDL